MPEPRAPGAICGGNLAVRIPTNRSRESQPFGYTATGQAPIAGNRGPLPGFFSTVAECSKVASGHATGHVRPMYGTSADDQFVHGID
ncbi:hypothetical protein PAAG_12310 [Paracoccidioides lutzii Pb01]|uniref:Uncharacterized protein n=1 Tax=Paracoccidioides lutzii (strain ATCC MYA-826 / Pb01) TaxID=502779 RepID=A0A0A2V3P9_PARBA|nr:hypothetical protein PAAG_12310 [Paracoccidioides lutzii Pb01]KGQ01002.1 hypothetical protein PAAG_12310 [Paracoccidioides lutzii Pb01]